MKYGISIILLPTKVYKYQLITAKDVNLASLLYTKLAMILFDQWILPKLIVKNINGVKFGAFINNKAKLIPGNNNYYTNMASVFIVHLKNNNILAVCLQN